MAWTSPRTWVTGETVTAAQLNAHLRDNLDALAPDAVTADAWTPILEATTTDPGDGSGSITATGRQWRVGAMQFVWVRFILAGYILADTPQGSGSYFVTLPVSASGIDPDSTSGQVIGSGRAFDASAEGNSVNVVVYLGSANTARFRLEGSSQLSSTNPFAINNGDVITFHASYPVA